MKRVITKRLLYREMATNHLFYGGEEYDGRLTNKNILDSIYEIGKHEWCPHCLSLYQKNNKGDLVYQIYVEQFEYAEKSWYNLLADNIKRILRI